MQELGQRLRQKGFEAGVSDEIVEKLAESGYIDDRAMAGALRLSAENTKHLGLHGARQYLRRMGISRAHADEALEGYDETESANRLAARKMNALSSCTASVARQRLVGYLGRRGFSYDTIRKTIEAFIKKEDHK
ncbi:MAG: RecX family transcriptional regulator [Hyphomicrobiaceae bacterium]|nr:RecX family transcriptional regulator [Hyphomicrobiaceae bacterium]